MFSAWHFLKVEAWVPYLSNLVKDAIMGGRLRNRQKHMVKEGQ